MDRVHLYSAVLGILPCLTCEAFPLFPVAQIKVEMALKSFPATLHLTRTSGFENEYLRIRKTAKLR